MKKLLYGVFALLSITAQAASVKVSLSVAGSVLPIPTWVDESGNKITNVEFKFDAIQTESKGDLVSAPVRIGLKNGSYPATISVSNPSGCAVGSSTVDASLRVDGVRVNNTFSLSSTAKSLDLLLPNASSEVGAVTCSVKGSLTYSY